MKNEFEWDDNKNESNKKKHGIDFNKAKEVFKDENSKTEIDSRKNYGEERWKIIGKMFKVIIVVIYTIRKQVIRIISARPAKRKEKKYITVRNQKIKNNPKMKNNKIYWKKAVELLKNNILISEYEVYFDDEEINVFDTILLGENGVDVPDELIFYDDDNIDCSDIPEITEEEFKLGKWYTNTGPFPIDPIRAIKKLKNGEDIAVYDVCFMGEKIKLYDAKLLRENNIEVPENLIIYDEKINFKITEK